MRLRPIFVSLGSFLLLASCVGAPERASVPPPRPAPPSQPRQAPALPPPPPAPVEWQFRPATPGNWTYRGEGAGSAAFFGAPGAVSLLTLRCDAATSRITLVRAGAGRSAMTVRTSYGAIVWPATPTAAGTVATRAANDVSLDRIAYSRGRFAVEVQGLEPLLLPNWAEVARVIEDCRR